MFSIKIIHSQIGVWYKKIFCISLCLGIIQLANSQPQSKQASYIVLKNTEVDSIINRRTDTIRYVDFHIHTTMKNYYNHIKSPSYLDSHSNDTGFEVINWSGSKKDYDNKFNNFKSYRQADFGILAESHASILASAITPIEKRLLSKQRPIGLLPFSFRFINGKLVSRLPSSRLKTLSRKDNSSNDEFRGELRFLNTQTPINPVHPNFKISLALDKNDLIQKFIDGETALVLTLEGGHIFHGKKISERKSYNSPVFLEDEQQEILDNVDSLKNLPNRVFFVTPGHFIWNGIVGSSKSLDMDNSKRAWLKFFSKNRRFRKKLFLKYGSGIMGRVSSDNTEKDVKYSNVKFCECDTSESNLSTGDIGWKVFKKLLDTSGIHHAPVFIDVKHMDIAARLEYYRYLKTRKDSIPIIASHIAVTGKDTSVLRYTALCPVSDVYEEVKDTKSFYDFQTGKWPNSPNPPCLDSNEVDLNEINWFYPWGINLATEEIKIIYDSEGIIGLALEERVLGTNRPNYHNKSFLNKIALLMQQENRSEQERKEFFSMLPFFKNMFFIVKHCGKNGPAAWDHLSLGSDFDGIAKPVSFCKSAKEIPQLYALIVKYLDSYIKLENCESLKYNLSSQVIARKIVFENGERFILKYF